VADAVSVSVWLTTGGSGEIAMLPPSAGRTVKGSEDDPADEPEQEASTVAV
jgi:hypothetical protein